MSDDDRLRAAVLDLAGAGSLWQARLVLATGGHVEVLYVSDTCTTAEAARADAEGFRRRRIGSRARRLEPGVYVFP